MKKKKTYKQAPKAKLVGKLPSSPQKMPDDAKVPNAADSEMRRLMKMNGKKS